MANIQGFHEAMSKIMPIILQVELEKQRQSRYLKNQLEEYAAYEASQSRLHQQELANSLVGEGARVAGGFAKGQPFSPTTFVEQLRGILTPEAMGALPFAAPQPTVVDKIEAARPALVRIFAAQARRIPPDPADLQAVAEAYGAEIPGTVVADVAQRQSEKEARKLGYAQLGQREEVQKNKATELGIKAKTAGAKVEDMKSTELKTLIDTYQGKAKQIQAQISDIYTTDEQKPALQAQLQEVESRLDLATNVLEQKIMAQQEKSDKDYDELIAELQTRGIDRGQVVANSDLRRQLLVQGYAVTKVLNRWK